MDCNIQIFDKVICEYKTLAEFTTDTVAGPMKHSALIVLLNIVSLDKHFNDLKLFLNQFPKKVEVLCISETRLTDSKIKFCELPGYNLYYCNSKGAFRLDAKQREVKVGNLRQPSRVVDDVTCEGCQPSRVVANLCDWLLHRLILIIYF